MITMYVGVTVQSAPGRAARNFAHHLAARNLYEVWPEILEYVGMFGERVTVTDPTKIEANTAQHPDRPWARNTYITMFSKIIFTDDSDAILFKLRWSDYIVDAPDGGAE
jgi:hypothetical protein